ncbi:HTH-type transcriptional activator RhaS [Paenibacillus allorhizoplanae]|uniref:HTH-type transcriptional activator RhaS n=1 Tax=Paenibacillus allorhizoplanae TaxID=2905648 RepID=A0ABM9C3I7_9BACL|nr:AraC family transcriptional regulator [Paenibacillus allorhizoplanae]CAH1202145.1 HTH-type transcriptional activator RhaS [Paenibacillus allorhizoplanae]
MIPFNLPGDPELHNSFPFTFKIHKLTADVPPHTHNFVEYTYCFYGSGTEIINGIERAIGPGTFTLLLPHQVHQIRITRGQELHLYIGAIGLQAIYGSDDIAASFSDILLRAGTEGDPSYQLADELTRQLLPIFERMHEEILSNRPLSQLMFKTKLTEALILLERSCFAKRDNDTYNPPNKKGKMWEIILYVYQHFRDDIKLETLAERFYLSVPHISTSFKSSIGENFHIFLEKIRISHACSLLISGNEPVTSVCFEVGFTSYATFSRVFKERLTMTPSAYRKLNSGSQVTN